MPKETKPEMPFNYPEMFRTARNSGRFSLREFAEKLQINTRSLERIEAGDTKPSADTLMRLFELEKKLEARKRD